MALTLRLLVQAGDVLVEALLLLTGLELIDQALLLFHE